MKPIQFPEATVTLARPQGMTEEECSPLPVFNDGEKSISCWEMTWRERLSALLFGKVWLYVWFGHTQPPVTLEATKTIFIKRRLHVKWTCSNSAHHEHRTRLGAWLCGRRQYLRSVIGD